MSRYFLKAVFCRVLATTSGLVSGLISIKLYSSHFTPELYGAVLLGLTIMSYLPLLDGGVSMIVNRSLLTGENNLSRSQVIKFFQVFYSFFLVVIFGVSAICMTVYAHTPTAAAAGQPLFFFWALGLAATMVMFGSARVGLLVGLGSQASLFLLNALSTSTNVFALWIALKIGCGVWAFPISNFASQALVMPIGFWIISKRQPDFKFLTFAIDDEFWRIFHLLKNESWMYFKTQIAITLLFTVDLIIVGIYCGPAQLAVYGMLSRLFAIIRAFLQATGEAAWPILMKEKGSIIQFSDPLLRVNALLYGSVMGGAAATLIPFCRSYLGACWTITPIVLSLLTARFLITGLATPGNFVLFGLGRLRTLMRSTILELVAGCIFANVLGWLFGMAGVAAGFLLGTSFGSLAPLIHGYAKATGTRTVPLLQRLWLRALITFGVSFQTAFAFAGIFTGTAVVLAGLGGVLATGVLVGLVTLLRMRQFALSKETLRRLIEYV